MKFLVKTKNEGGCRKKNLNIYFEGHTNEHT